MNSTLVDTSGKRLRKDASTAIKIRNWSRGSKKACDGVGFCEGMIGMLTACAQDTKTRITAVGELSELQTGSPDAIGLLTHPAKELFLFNHCPACGSRLKLPANRRL